MGTSVAIARAVHFGAKVVYPPTLRPAREHEIPIVIRNTFNPSFGGTRVLERVHGNGRQVRGISSVDEVALLRLEGDGMVFVHAGGCVVERSLDAGETLQVDTGCVVAFESGIHFEVQQVGDIKTALFGGEGLFFAELRGPLEGMGVAFSSSILGIAGSSVRVHRLRGRRHLEQLVARGRK